MIREKKIQERLSKLEKGYSQNLVKQTVIIKHSILLIMLIGTLGTQELFSGT